MSASEQQLRAIAESPRFEMISFGQLHDHLRDVDLAITNILKTSPTWKGATADTAVDLLKQYAIFFRKIDRQAYKLEANLATANREIDSAVKVLGNLPSTVVPAEIAEAVGTTVKFQGVDIPVNGAVGFVANLLAGNREKAAREALDTLHERLQAPRQELGDNEGVWPPTPVPRYPAPERNGEDDSVDDGDGAPGVRPPGGTSRPPTPPGYNPPTPTDYETGVLVPPPTYVVDPPYDPVPPDTDVDDPSVDGDTDGDDPRIGGKDPRWNPPTTPPGTGGGGGGLVPGLGGAGAAAGLAAAARAGGMGAGGMGAAATGAGARLGSGLSGGAGGASGGGASAAGAAGGRGGAGTGMMGGGAGGAAEEKEKRSGLGGLIAPKLEDDEELGPRSAAADAGGRDQ